MADKKTIIAIKVKFELNTKDGLRRVNFGLEKDKKENIETWKISFKLFERDKKADPFGDALISLDVEVDAELFEDAENVAQANRLSTAQKVHALTTAANDAKAAKAGDIPEDEANQSVQDTLAA